MRFVLLPVFLAALAVQDGDAEKVFRAMEKKIVSARAIHIEADIVGKEKDKEAKLHASIFLGRGNKARIKIDGTIDEKEEAIELLSDGKNLRMKMAKEELAPKLEATPDHFTRTLGAALSRVGIAVGLKAGHKLEVKLKEPEKKEKALDKGPKLKAEGVEKEKEKAKKPGKDKDKEKFEDPVKTVVRPKEKGEPDLEKMFALKGFKAGESEKVDGQEATVVHYDVKVGDKHEARVTLWVSAKTQLPLKRRIVVEKDMIEITETYKEFKLNPKLDADVFNIAK